MNLNIALISVIVSGFVAIAGIFGPALVSLVTDSRKWSREQQAVKSQQITAATKVLIDQLGVIRGGRTKFAAGTSTWQHRYGVLVSAFYSFEQAVWARCGKSEIRRLEKLRSKIETDNSYDIYEGVPSLIKEIIEISDIATRQGKKVP